MVAYILNILKDIVGYKYFVNSLFFFIKYNIILFFFWVAAIEEEVDVNDSHFNVLLNIFSLFFNVLDDQSQSTTNCFHILLAILMQINITKLIITRH